MEDISINFETRVSSYLNFLISVKETRTYSEIADKCDIKPPGKIRKINRILLKITENDIIDKKPIRSAVIVSKINKMNGNNIPHEDFFLFLSKNKIYNGEKNIKSYTQFHKKLIRELFSQISFFFMKQYRFLFFLITCNKMFPETSQKCFKSRFAAGSSAIISITSPLL